MIYGIVYATIPSLKKVLATYADVIFDVAIARVNFEKQSVLTTTYWFPGLEISNNLE